MRTLQGSLLVAVLSAAGLHFAPAASSQLERDPQIKILGPQGRLNFEIRPREACDSFEPSEIRIRFSGHGTTRTFTVQEPCGDWSGNGRAMPSVRIAPEDGTSRMAGRLRLRAVGSSEVKRSYRYEIRIDGTLEESGRMKVDVRREDGRTERYLYIDD